MQLYRIDYEIDTQGNSGTAKHLSFRATKLEVAQLKKEIGITLIDFKAQKINVPTGRYELAGWLNKTFGTLAQDARKASAK